MNINLWLAAACLAASVSAHATSEFKPIQLNDQELSTLRGRYVMPGRIVYFGMTMTSTWQNAAGDVVGARTTLQIQKNVITPQFFVTLISQKGNGSAISNGTGSITGGAGLSTVQGVTQSTRTAGDYNTSGNNVDINVQQNGQAPTVASQGQALMNGSTISGGNSAGNVAVSSTNGGIQVAIQGNNNQGNSMQSVASGGVLQNINLTGGGNLVQNLTQLNVVLGNQVPSAGSLNANLEQLRNLRSSGF
jgi:hypothetical protein